VITICRTYDNNLKIKHQCFHVNRSAKDAWSCLSDIHHNLKKSRKVATKAVDEGLASTTALHILAMEKIGVFYAAVTIFFRAVWQYCKIVNRTDEQGMSWLLHTPVLVFCPPTRINNFS
jgi:hypothetical protein